MSELRYTEDHEWLRHDEDGLVTLGITDHAQEQLGDVVFVQLPDAGTRFAAGDEAVVIESVKAAGENSPSGGRCRGGGQFRPGRRAGEGQPGSRW